MDQEWFAIVAKRLAELEIERQQRFASSDDSDTHAPANRETLFQHPAIVRSLYWHSDDVKASSASFDWNACTFPQTYINSLRRLPSNYLHRVGCRPYDPQVNFPTIQVENTRILVARILLLKLDHLLA